MAGNCHELWKSWGETLIFALVTIFLLIGRIFTYKIILQNSSNQNSSEKPNLPSPVIVDEANAKKEILNKLSPILSKGKISAKIASISYYDVRNSC